MDPGSFQRTALLPAYVFSEMAALKAKAAAAGRPVFDFSLGNPDGDPPGRVLATLRDSLAPGAYRYAEPNGSRALRQAMALWYLRHYGVHLDPDAEILPVLGTKEGIGHLLLATLGPGDALLAPSPSYPIHLWGGRIAGAEVLEVPIGPGERYADNARRVAKEAKGRLRGLLACFPHNPTGVTAGAGELEDLLALARERDLFFLHDLAYADMDFGRARAPSALALPGARERTVEFFSLSKSYNMPGFRVGFCCGSRTLVAALGRMKSYLDYGMFNPIQAAARVALEECDDFALQMRECYRRRARALADGMAAAGWEVGMPGGSMFTWAPLPATWVSAGSGPFSLALFEATGIAVSSGAGFGKGGEGFVRFALLEDEARTAEACLAVKRFLGTP